jgi:hypothetical protein
MGIFKSEPHGVTVNGKPLLCLACQNDGFYRREAQLHGQLATLIDLEWMSPNAILQVCSACGYIHWFLPTK